MEFLNQSVWVTSFLLVIIAVTLFFSYQGFRKRAFKQMMIMGIIQTCLSPLFAYTIGPLLLAIGVTQFYMGIVNKRKVNTIKQVPMK